MAVLVTRGLGDTGASIVTAGLGSFASLSITVTVPPAEGISWLSGSSPHLGWTISSAVDVGEFAVGLTNQTSSVWYTVGYFAAVPAQTTYTPTFSLLTEPESLVPAGDYKVWVYYRIDTGVWVWPVNGTSPGIVTITPLVTLQTTAIGGGFSSSTTIALRGRSLTTVASATNLTSSGAKLKRLLGTVAASASFSTIGGKLGNSIKTTPSMMSFSSSTVSRKVHKVLLSTTSSGNLVSGTSKIARKRLLFAVGSSGSMSSAASRMESVRWNRSTLARRVPSTGVTKTSSILVVRKASIPDFTTP